MSQNIILEVKNLRKSFGDFLAIDDISFSLGEGKILGFLGPNGAGKSTTIYCLLGLIDPDFGQISIFGKDIKKARSEILKQVNYASAEFHLPWNLKLWECLFVFGKLYEVKNINKRIDELLEIFEISHLKNKHIRELSFGQRARGNLVKALLNKPKILLLDEPMASMDPDVVDKGINLIKQIQKEEKISILYTSHNMWEIEQVANHVVFIKHGKIIAQGSPLELTKQVLQLESDEPNLREVFIQLSRVKRDEFK
ncbi:ABC transporter ATP-binding protein [Candidatus Daviesbacteria bacterium]|nr:ABC transporter ATP-binding protein [Candidatus Daviesbacteria bacterium]